MRKSLKLSLKLFCLLVLAIILCITIAGCGGAPTENDITPANQQTTTGIGFTTGNVADKIEFIQPNVIPETSLDIFLSIYDKDNQLLNSEGKVDITLWDSEDSASNGGTLIQQWNGLPVTAAGFEDDLGNWLTLPYAKFVPQPSQYGYIKITFTALNGSKVACEGPILLLKGSCCA